MYTTTICTYSILYIHYAYIPIRTYLPTMQEGSMEREDEEDDGFSSPIAMQGGVKVRRLMVYMGCITWGAHMQQAGRLSVSLSIP